MKYIALILGLLLVLPGVMAQGVSAGITPESPLYSLDLLVDHIRMNFGGAETRVLVMEERMAEAELMNQKGKYAEMTRALEEHTKTRQRIQSEMERKMFNTSDLVVITYGLNRAETQLTQLKKATPEQAQAGLDTALNQIQTQQEQVNKTQEQLVTKNQLIPSNPAPV